MEGKVFQRRNWYLRKQSDANQPAHPLGKYMVSPNNYMTISGVIGYKKIIRRKGVVERDILKH